ncbi:MAG: class I SAM-dependent methyltransferase [Flavobacteriales bacterium]
MESKPDIIPTCIICGNTHLKNHFYPPNIFNNKEFRYYSCPDCGSASVSPLPVKEDYDKIYGVEDHSYLKAMKEGEKIKYDFKWGKYNHRTYQINFFRESCKLAKGKKLLDYATGSGFYLAYAKELGYEGVGIEYSSEFAALLKSKSDLNIVSLQEFKQKYAEQKFDIIHFGHILEHVEKPSELIKQLIAYAHAETIFIVDGPLENNFCFSALFIKLGSLLKRKKHNAYPPQHLSFTNYKSQLLVFEKAGLKKLTYKVVEQDFPLPDKPQWGSPVSLISFIISRISIQLSKLHPKAGNVFHYVGKLNT